MFVAAEVAADDEVAGRIVVGTAADKVLDDVLAVETWEAASQAPVGAQASATREDRSSSAAGASRSDTGLS